MPRFFKSSWRMWGAAVVAVLTTSGSFCEAGMVAQSDTAGTVSSAPSEPHFSPGSIEVLKLADAKVSNEVIEAYIRNSSFAYNPTAGEIIALRHHGVSDSVITTMLNRGGELRAQH